MIYRTLALCTLWLCCAPTARAEHVISMLVENDVFTGTDRHYTSGVMFNYISGVDDGPRRLRRMGVRFPGIEEGDAMHVSVSLGHEIYTPTDIRAAELLPDDRPYAGHLYLAAGFSTANTEEIETWRLSLGLVGPGARGEWVQNTVHDAIEEEPANGWDNQLDNEWVLSAEYEKKWLNRGWYGSEAWLLEVDAIPRVNAAVGTPLTYAGLGGMLRIGRGLQKDHGPPRVRPSMPLSQFYDTDLGSSWYLFAGVDGRFVVHNLFLDGNNFDSSHSVDKRDWVAELQAGFVWNNRRFRLGYTYVVRTREFEGQDEADIFGSMTLSLHF